MLFAEILCRGAPASCARTPLPSARCVSDLRYPAYLVFSYFLLEVVVFGYLADFTGCLVSAQLSYIEAIRHADIYSFASMPSSLGLFS